MIRCSARGLHDSAEQWEARRSTPSVSVSRGIGASHVTIAGQSIAAAHDRATGLGHAEANARAEAMARWLRGEDAEEAPSRALTGREVLLGSAFSLSSARRTGRIAVGRVGPIRDQQLRRGGGRE